jgi:hypothetical protein
MAMSMGGILQEIGSVRVRRNETDMRHLASHSKEHSGTKFKFSCATPETLNRTIGIDECSHSFHHVDEEIVVGKFFDE